MKIYILYIISFLLFFSCEDATAVRENPLDEEGGDYIIPIIDLSDITEGDTLFSETIQFNLSGNELVSEYRYKYDSYGWVDWNEEGSITLNYLDEGDHDLSVQSRYLNGDTSEISRVNFVIDAVDGPSLMFLPRRNFAELGEIVIFQILAEEVLNLMLTEIHLEYDPTLLEIISVSQGSFFQNGQNSLFIHEINSEDGFIQINTALLDGDSPSVSGTGDLASIEVKFLQSQDAMIQFASENTFLDRENDYILINSKIDGIILSK
jgi:hypothetical protein